MGHQHENQEHQEHSKSYYLACLFIDSLESASSSIIILCRPGGNDTLFMAKDLILFRTTSIPRESLAFNSSTPVE